MKKVRTVEILSYLEGYYKCLEDTNSNPKHNWEIAMEETRVKYSKMPLYKSALAEVLEELKQ